MGDLVRFPLERRTAGAAKPQRLKNPYRKGTNVTVHYTSQLLDLPIDAVVSALEDCGRKVLRYTNSALADCPICEDPAHWTLHIDERAGASALKCERGCDFEAMANFVGSLIEPSARRPLVDRSGDLPFTANSKNANCTLMDAVLPTSSLSRPWTNVTGSSKDSSKDSSVGIPTDSRENVDETRARLSALDVELTGIDEAFECPLPDHDHEAWLLWTGTYWKVCCGETRRSYGLAEVRAARAYGHLRRISATEAQRWRDRLDYEADLLKPVGLSIMLRDEVSAAARQLAFGQLLYLGLRAARPGGFAPTEPFTFAREFAMAWTGLTSDQVRHGTRELRQSGIATATAERVGRALLWRMNVRALDDATVIETRAAA
jgi:hypothetical protein